MITTAIFLLVLFVITLTVAAYSTYGERKVAAFMQDRIGPDRAGPFGLLQPLADGGKMFMKEDFVPATANRKLFFLGKTWRRGEIGPLHAPEFTMIEWYRANAPYEEIMDDCIEIVRIAARAAGSAMLNWRERSCDPFTAAERISVRDAFAQLCPTPMPADGDAFSAALVQHVEPLLGDGAMTLLKEYPISEAALARRCAHDASVAERFELYACGVELANGFGELTDPVEQRERLVAAMDEKAKRYGTRWPIDEEFLAALAHMPSSSGVAMGFDRVVMLATGARHINDVLWTP